MEISFLEQCSVHAPTKAGKLDTISIFLTYEVFLKGPIYYWPKFIANAN